MKSMKLEARKTRFFSKKILLVVSVVYVVMSIGAFITYELRLEETLLQIPPEARPYAGDTAILCNFLVWYDCRRWKPIRAVLDICLGSLASLRI